MNVGTKSVLGIASLLAAAIGLASCQPSPDPCERGGMMYRINECQIPADTSSIIIRVDSAANPQLS
jgi:hypothetical protein